jgi:transcriptional regulator with XRE-family HTH domain
MAGGRPSKYKPEYAQQAEKLTELGATDRELASFFGVSISTIWEWTSRHPEFSSSLKGAKAAFDDRIERSLAQRALGYSYEAEKIFNYQGEIIRTTYTEHVPPDPTSMIFWLKNRRRTEWRDRRNEPEPDDGVPYVDPDPDV